VFREIFASFEIIAWPYAKNQFSRGQEANTPAKPVARTANIEESTALSLMGCKFAS
jgi:hypothetical protein